MDLLLIKSLTKIAFLLNLLNLDRLQLWGYDMLGRGNTDDFYLELAICKTDRDVLDTFQEIPNEKEAVSFFMDYFFGFFRNTYKRENWQRIQENMITFVRIVDISEIEDSIQIFLIRLKDDFYLRAEGFSGSMQMPAELVSFLRKYQKFTLIQTQLNKICFPKLEVSIS